MKNFKYLLYLLICFFVLLNEPISAKVVFHGGYAFETFKGQKVAAAYVSIFNQSDNDVVNLLFPDYMLPYQFSQDQHSIFPDNILR